MSTTLTIPAAVIADLREGLFCLLGGAAEAILYTLEQPEREYHPEWFHEERRQLERVLALLDMIGWDAGCEAKPIELERVEHGHTLREAVDAYLPLLEDQAEEVARCETRSAEERASSEKEAIATRLARLRQLARSAQQGPAGAPPAH